MSRRHAMAIDHVTGGRAIIARQRELIRMIRNRRGDSSTAESLLDAFERSQAIFEDDLALIEKAELG